MTRSNIPNPSGAHPMLPNEDRRKKRPLWLALLAALVVAALIVLAIVLLARHHNKKNAAAPVAPVVATTPAVTQSPSLDATSASAVSTAPETTTAAPTTAPATTTAPAAGAGGAGTLTANSAALLPAPAGDNADLGKYVGQKATAKGVLVLSSPADNGFWVGTSAKDEVWVQLLLPGLVSPHPVAKGNHVSFPGTVVANSANFAHNADVSLAEGAARLTAQHAHLQVAKTDITFTK